MTPSDRELLRHAALDALALRHPAALSAGGIKRALVRDLPFPVPDEDLDSALALLAATTPPLIECNVDPLGTTKYYRATPDGVIKAERSSTK
jgi:hypothetical protein